MDICRSQKSLNFDSDLVEDMSMTEWVPGTDFQLAQHDQAGQIQAALQALPPRQRLAISLWAYHDYTVLEISDVLQVDRNAADQLLHRAKAKLRKKLEDLHEYAR
jgi:RNA polymerase sigma-70 factor (ECF subfamily)